MLIGSINETICPHLLDHQVMIFFLLCRSDPSSKLFGIGNPERQLILVIRTIGHQLH